MSDTFQFDISGGPINPTLAIATAEHTKVRGWSVDNEGTRLVLYWSADSEPAATPLPAPLEGDAIKEFVLSWLREVQYPPVPDNDGSVKKSFRMYNEAWGHVNNSPYAFVAIEPFWNEYGK